MKTLIIEKIEPKKIGELVTVGKILGEEIDILALGEGPVPGPTAAPSSARTALPQIWWDVLPNWCKKTATRRFF